METRDVLAQFFLVDSAAPVRVHLLKSGCDYPKLNHQLIPCKIDHLVDLILVEGRIFWCSGIYLFIRMEVNLNWDVLVLFEGLEVQIDIRDSPGVNEDTVED